MTRRQEIRKAQMRAVAENIKLGLSEKEALKAVFPKDRQRARRMRKWKESGLWPLPPESGTTSNTQDHTETLDKEPTTSYNSTTSGTPEGHTEPAEATEAELPAEWKKLMDVMQLRIDRALDAKLAAIFQNIGGTEARRREGDEPMNKFTISMPAPLHRELKRLEGSVSSHITEAVKLYLNTRKVYK